MPTTWNPADLANCTLTNGNLTVTFASTSQNQGVRSVFSASTGKFYFETTITHGGVAPQVGMALASANLTTVQTNSTGAVVWNSNYIYVNNNLTLNMGASIGNGDVASVAVDIGGKRIWYRRNGGNWNANATYDPGAGTGGIDITSVTTGAVFALGAGQQSGGINGVIGANFGAAAFTYAPPGGFTVGLGPAAVAQARVIVMA